MDEKGMDGCMGRWINWWLRIWVDGEMVSGQPSG